MPYGKIRFDGPLGLANPPDYARFYDTTGLVSGQAVIVGPVGYGDHQFVPAATPLPYAIVFENPGAAECVRFLALLGCDPVGEAGATRRPGLLLAQDLV